jgi:hypothetical protein
MIDDVVCPFCGEVSHRVEPDYPIPMRVNSSGSTRIVNCRVILCCSHCGSDFDYTSLHDLTIAPQPTSE